MQESKAFVNIFLLAIYKLRIALRKTVTFFTRAKSENDKPSTAQDIVHDGKVVFSEFIIISTWLKEIQKKKKKTQKYQSTQVRKKINIRDLSYYMIYSCHNLIT